MWSHHFELAMNKDNNVFADFEECMAGTSLCERNCRQYGGLLHLLMWSWLHTCQ